ncbi:MAG TPA: hypothetical protein VKH18_18510 [Terriglobales bacterium]|nr:hypothetical protein [Terriglobales bacterium]
MLNVHRFDPQSLRVTGSRSLWFLSTRRRRYQLRVSAIRPGSFEMVILAWIVLGQAPGPLQNLEMVHDAARWVITRIFSMIEVKKLAQNGPLDITINGNNNTLFLLNANGANLEVPIELLELIRDKSLDSDLSKIVSPLEPSKIESTKVTAETEDQPTLEETVTSDEREYFSLSTTVTTREAEITGKFISLNKENNRGTFELQNGKHVPYKYSGPNADTFPRQFARKGPVQVNCIATFDENLEPKQLDVKAARHLQAELPLESN